MNIHWFVLLRKTQRDYRIIFPETLNFAINSPFLVPRRARGCLENLLNSDNPTPTTSLWRKGFNI